MYNNYEAEVMYMWRSSVLCIHASIIAPDLPHNAMHLGLIMLYVCMYVLVLGDTHVH